MPVPCNVNLMECLSEQIMLERQPVSTSIMRNKPTTKLVQVFQLTVTFNLHVLSQEMEMGVLQHSLTLYPREGQTREVLKWTGWNLRYEAKSMSPFDECPTPNHNFLMNIVIWVYKKKKKKSSFGIVRVL